MLFKSTVIDRRVNLFVIGLNDTVAALVRWAVVMRRFNILGVYCPADPGTHAAALGELGVALLRKIPVALDQPPDLVVLTGEFSKEDARRILGGETYETVSVAHPALATALEEIFGRYYESRGERVLLEAIFSATQDAISVVDEEGRVILVNEAYTRLTGLTERDVIGRPCAQATAEGTPLHMKVLETRQPVSGARLFVGPKKTEVIAGAAPIVSEDRLKGSVAGLHDVSQLRRLHEELSRAQQMIRHLSARYRFEDLVGESRLLGEAVQRAREAAVTPVTVLLIGESGTGKELFAHAIHNASPRSTGPFVRVNCSAIAGSLMESELFGYEDGAFTGARRGGRKGLIEEAAGGTLFLDEVGKMDLKVQAELLRVLQEKEITRVGGTKTLPVDVRIVVATNADLARMVREGTFREDLYYRINVVPIALPPLRVRREDIALLVHHLIRKFNQEFGRCVEGVTPEAMAVLEAHGWPGNVRELENVIGRAMIGAGYNARLIGPEHVGPLGAPAAAASPSPAGAFQGGSLKDILEAIEREILVRTIEECGGNKTEAARRLGIAVRNLYYRLYKYGLVKEQP